MRCSGKEVAFEKWPEKGEQRPCEDLGRRYKCRGCEAEQARLLKDSQLQWPCPNLSYFCFLCFSFIWLFICFEQSLRGKGQKVVLGLYVIVQWLSHVWLFGSPWIAAFHVSLSFTISRSWLKFMFIELVMLSNHLILCHPLLLLPSIFTSMGVFSSESALHIRWPKY